MDSFQQRGPEPRGSRRVHVCADTGNKGGRRGRDRGCLFINSSAIEGSLRSARENNKSIIYLLLVAPPPGVGLRLSITGRCRITPSDSLVKRH